jgi:hypothetical protein
MTTTTTPPQVPLTLASNNPVPTMTVTVGNQQPVMLLDTGSSWMLVNYYKLTGSLPPPASPPEPPPPPAPLP